MNSADYLKDKLKKYKKEDIVITSHAKVQAIMRGIRPDEVKENITNTFRLVYAEKQEALGPGEEKYNCYFGCSNTQCHRYALVVNDACLVCTVIKINRRWQRMVEKNAKV